MLSFVEKYKGNAYSQNGEDQIIKECLSRINPKLKVAVEFGGADGFFCSNTALLRLDKNWKVYQYDMESSNERLVDKRTITPSNVNDLPPCSVLSIDIDGNDYEVWKAYNGKPDIVVIEINSSLPPMKAHFSPEKGSSYITMALLALEKGYFILCHTGNLVCVLAEHRGLFPEIEGDGVNNYQQYFNTSWQ